MFIGQVRITDTIIEKLLRIDRTGSYVNLSVIYAERGARSVLQVEFSLEIEDGPPFATGPSAAALPALPIVTPLGMMAEKTKERAMIFSPSD